MIIEKKYIELSTGEKLHANIVENGSPVWIVVTHGLGEHSGRHEYMYKLFAQYFNICIYDLRGHGKSEGKKANIDQFSDFTSDLSCIIKYLKNSYAMKKYILFGHSMGGLIVASFMQNHVDPKFYPKKVFLSAPASAGAGHLGTVFNLAPMKIMKGLSSLPVSVPLGGVLDLTKLSHDPRNYENYITDDLNNLKIHSKLFLEILFEARKVFSKPLRIKCDFYCALGSKDEIVGTENTIKYFQTVEKNVNLKIIEDGYHELHNEIERYRIPYFEFLKKSIIEDN